ncbi:MAG: NAD+ synthase [Rhodospirillales bacterium]|nr:NAD+ synthase [Rhodospirillales bacterium]
MTDRLTIALAQINPTVGDVAGNRRRIAEARARAPKADLVVVGELATTGYPPEDLVLKPAFQERVRAAVDELAAETKTGPALLIGAPWRQDDKLYNAAILLDGGAIAGVSLKHELPNYGVFDERRVFAAGPLPGPLVFRDVRLGVLVCEDMWKPDVTECLQESGAEILVVINGSPFETDKPDTRITLATARVFESGLPLAYVNIVGGQDELVFDGGSFVLGADHSLRVHAPSWTPDVTLTEWQRGKDGWVCADGPKVRPADGVESIYRALVLGLGDYVNKNRFGGVLLGLSGGIDSALTAAIAVDAIGPIRVRAVMMPSPFTSQDSLDDAAETARALGIVLDTINIGPAMTAFGTMLADAFKGRSRDTTEENIQARARGITLMALSNKFGHMVVSTGNKSEMSVGYATLYGDMCGGYAILKDVYKTTVYALSRWRNEALHDGSLGPKGAMIPERVLTKAPTAELRPNQTDQDSLPPYSELDAILSYLIEGEMSPADIAAKGHDPATVKKVWTMVDRAEYKRRQAPPGVKITFRAFGRDRRYPITNAFTDQI